MHHANDNHTVLTYLSVCSGIEAASVAWNPLGWRGVAYSEIEKFPSAVLAHHYPDVPNLGDFTKIDVRTLGCVDILAGGTPCQAFSVAGLRQSLADARGNLSLEFVRLAHELAANNGLRNVVWENVVGVLSTKDNALGCFLAGLVGADSALIPSERPADGKSSRHWKWSRKEGRHIVSWPTHGMVAGPKGRAAWAVKDGQFFRVAQRRRRVLLVADFGAGADPAAVLFESESLPRDTPPSREKGKDVAPTISARTKGGGGLGTDFDLDGGLVESPVAYGGNRTSGPIDVSPALAAHPGPHGRQSFESEAFLVQAIGVTGEVAHTLKAEGADASEDGTGRGTPIVCIHADSIGRAGEAITPSADAAGVVRLRNPGMGIANDGTSYNLMASGQPHAVAIPFDTTQVTSLANRSNPKDGDPCHPLSAQSHPPAICFSAKDYGADASVDIAPTLRAGGHAKSHANAGVMPAVALQSSQSGVRVGEVHATLDSNNGSRRHNGAIVGSAVRRLTPVECERLQGFPDNYTAIPWRGKPADQCPDGPRYKALGNSWAVPKFAWLGARIQRLMPPIPANDNLSAPAPLAV